MLELRSEDMYGNSIYPLGETGYGVSLCFHGKGDGSGNWLPDFTVFHFSDGFRQCLLSVALDDPDRAILHDIFTDRIAELIALNPHGAQVGPSHA